MAPFLQSSVYQESHKQREIMGSTHVPDAPPKAFLCRSVVVDAGAAALAITAFTALIASPFTAAPSSSSTIGAGAGAGATGGGEGGGAGRVEGSYATPAAVPCRGRHRSTCGHRRFRALHA